MISTVWLAVIVVGQGEAVEIVVPHLPGQAAATIEWANASRALAPQQPVVPGATTAGGEWALLLGVDIDEPAGKRSLVLERSFADGRATTEPLELRIEPKSYPETRLTVDERYVELSHADQARAVAEAEEVARIYATVTPTQYWRWPFSVPVEGVAGGRNFGHRRYFNGEPRAPHSGADLRAAEGTPVRASNNGVVVLAKPLFFSGNAIFVDHGLGVYSVYLHLSEFRVDVGDVVGQGDLLGLAGATGRVTGPHLHWGARIYGARVDPFTLVASPAR